MMTDSKVYELFPAQYPTDKAGEYFMGKYGYPPDTTFCYLGWLRAGPVYRTRLIEQGDIAEGQVILVNGAWVTVELIDGGQVLTDSGELLDLPALVTARE